MKKTIITKHAKNRAKIRLGWSLDVLKKRSKKALNSDHSTLPLHVTNYIKTAVWVREDSTVKFYDNVLFIFRGNKLLTLYKYER